MVINLISNYKLVGDTLILYLDFNYEFGGNKGKKGGFEKSIREYIRNNKINFHGGVITFVG